MDDIISLERSIKTLRAYQIIPNTEIDGMLWNVDRVKDKLNSLPLIEEDYQPSFKSLIKHSTCPHCGRLHDSTLYSGFCSENCWVTF
jgi:hypothetical protein